MKELVSEYLIAAPSKDKSFLKVQVIRFLIAGGTSAVLELGILFALVQEALWHYLMANFVAFALVNFYNYILSRYWVYGPSKFNMMKEVLSFFVVVLVGLGVNQVILYAMFEIVGWNLIISKLTATAITVVWNFTCKKFIVFKGQTSFSS